MIIDDEAQRAILDRLDAFGAELSRLRVKQATDYSSLLARQQRQENVAAEIHEDVGAMMRLLDVTAAAVKVLMHAKYGTEGDTKV